MHNNQCQVWWRLFLTKEVNPQANLAVKLNQDSSTRIFKRLSLSVTGFSSAYQRQVIGTLSYQIL